MPEENDNGTNVSLALDRLEPTCLNNNLTKTQDYNTIHNALAKGENLNLEQTERLLAICIHDLKEDMKYTATIMNIIPAILSRVQMGKYDPCPNLLPSALAVLHIIKTTANLNKVETLKTLCYETLLSYPEDVLIAMAEHHVEVMELFNLYLHMRIPTNIRLQTYNVLYKLLKILPPENKRVFIEKGMVVWFSKIIPTIMTHVSLNDSECELVVKLLELLTDELVSLDYTESPHWQYLLECICISQKYPAVMKNLLQNGSVFWHRLWIVFIRLLKNQITQSMGSIGTPINSMLPVVEAAFKVDVDNRCKAFECWNVLIDSFSTETNESNINKRFKLLIIPLKSNNAKAEATALAKFKCWWHLIQKFQNKIDKFIDTVLVSFLHFCFGKHNATDKSALVPGQISIALRKQCIQALVDMVGHVNCDGCTELPKLKAKLINTKNLVDNWNHWIFSLTSTIMMSATTDNGLTTQQMTCLWKSFLMTIGELPENNIRKDLFSEMLSILVHLVQECRSNSKLADIVFNALILSLFDGDKRISQLLKTRCDLNDPLYKVFSVLVDQSLSRAYQSYSSSELVTKLKKITDIILDPVLSSPSHVIGSLLKGLPVNDIGVTIWIALVESICESNYDLCVKTLGSVMMWPLKSEKLITEIKPLAMKWYTTYDLFHEKLKECDIIQNAISKFLFTIPHVNQSTVYFKLCVTLSVIKTKLTDTNCTACEKEIELLHCMTNYINSYESFEQLFPILCDRVVAAIMVLIPNINETLTRYILLCAKKMLTVMTQACNQLTDISQILPLVGNLLNSLDSLLKVGSYVKLIPVIVDDLIDCSSYLSKQSVTKGAVLSVLKTFASKIVENDITYKKIKGIIDGIENNTNNLEKNQVSDKKEFTTPKAKEVPKRMKKKEPSIVNTVTENGEEYVVVKSNWKFNPRKLTENQKEKFQRKREDIPALYQDLSQSQDEYKLEAWKTDSQDTSNSSRSESKSSKTGRNESATEMLSNLPSSDVVPKILENFFSENIKKDSANNSIDLASKDNHVNKLVTSPAVTPVTPKNTKSPRMALKDRVFRNVRNLIEKSGMQKENKDAYQDLNKTDNIIKTPTQSKTTDVATVVNSAPPLLAADRPSRVKRKPKKFDELQLLSAKKKRQSLQNLKVDNKSGKSDFITTPSDTDTNKEDNINNKEVDSPIDSVSDERLNKLDNVQAAEKPKTSDTNEDIQSNESLQKKSSENNHTTDEVIEAIGDKDKDQHVTILDSDICIVTDGKNNENSNDMEVESSIDKEDETVTNKKDENDTNNEKSKNNENVTSEDVLGQNANDALEQTLNEKNDKQVSDVTMDESKEKTHEISNEEQGSPNTKDLKAVSTPQQVSKKGTEEQKSTAKKPKKSRIEKELAIDMVEGHPFLKMQSEKRLTRKAVESIGVGRRKSLVDKLNKSKSYVEANISLIKSDKKTKEKNKESDGSNSSVTIDESQEKDTENKDRTSFTEDIPYSDDVIESSQDSTITTISVKSTKKTCKKIPIVSLQKIKLNMNKSEDINGSQSILDSVIVGPTETSKANQESKDDIELPLNKTALDEKSQADLTENMDTEPINEKELTEVVIVINDDLPAPLTISSDETVVGPETQELAEADTQPTDPKDFMDIDLHETVNKSVNIAEETTSDISTIDKIESLCKEKSINEKSVRPSENDTITLSESACAEFEKDGASSPSSFRDEAKRKQDFLNNTLEISPIKNMSPERTKKSPSPDSSGDFVVIKLSSPVHSNGEPFEKCGSPEVFTEDKVSPDKRDQSPPRAEVTVTNTSPSSSLSLKKNRPQVRSGGRAAQMLGLCVPDSLQTITNSEKIETDEVKKTSASSTPASRRHLRILYHSSVSENTEPNTANSENDDSDNFLKFRRSLPTVDSSPSGPILKRKLIEIDDVTISPASKRKRVSFHDPPVSTTISVQKYIEPGVLRSPQNSAHKRLERQLRQQTPIKSPKRLDHAFKLDTVLTKAIESFSETEVITIPDDTPAFSLDETPVVEIVRASELNDTDPICPELLDCTDPIDKIAGELSSNAMKSLLVKELEGKIETVGDLAKMTELEVNRLCIKAPKVKVAKKVLSDYASKRVERPPSDVMVTIDEAIFDEPMPEPVSKGVEIEVQTDIHDYNEMEVQTIETPTTVIAIQTDTTPTAHSVVQTDESGSKSTADIVKLCLTERPDFVEQVSTHLEETSIQQITDKLSFNAITDVLMKKVDPSTSKTLFNRLLEMQCNDSSPDTQRSKELSLIRDYVCDRFDSKDLIMFCSDVLKSVYDKPAFP